MHLISYVLASALKGLVKFGALVLTLFLGVLLVQAMVPTIRDAVADRDRLQQVAEERAALESELEQLKRSSEEGQSEAVDSLTAAIEAEVAEGRLAVSKKKDDLERVRQEHELCGWRGEVLAWIAPGNSCDDAEAAVEAADEALDTVEANLEQAEQDAAILRDPNVSAAEKLARVSGDGGQSIVEREIDNTQADLDQKQAEESSLAEAQNSWAGRVVNTWSHAWKWLVVIAAVVFILPRFMRLVSYFLLMPLVTSVHKPIHLAAGKENAAARLRAEPAERTLTVRLSAGEVLSARSEYVRPVGGKIRSVLLYDRSSPFISFASGLRGLSRVTGDDSGTSVKVTAPDDPDAYLMRIDFEHHPGVVMQPKHVVGIIGTPQLETRWRWGIQSFATWQVRYILFVGTGSLLVRGSGDVVAQSPEGSTARMDQNLVMGFDSRLAARVGRTEVFLPYLRGKTSLVLDEFAGHDSLFWQKSTADGPSNPIAKTSNTFFSALGKLLGF